MMLLPTALQVALGARHDHSRHCCRTVPELLLLTGLALSLERKQMPQVVENIENHKYGMEPLEGGVLRPRQMRSPCYAATMYSAVGISGCEPRNQPPMGAAASLRLGCIDLPHDAATCTVNRQNP
jgi:hypothetical protein